MQHTSDLVQFDNGRIFDLRTRQQLHPPTGRRFHPDLTKFALDGRFVPGSIGNQSVLIDTRTEKYFPTPVQDDGEAPAIGNLPGFGLVAALKAYGAEIHLQPPADRLSAIPPDLLELWAQVAVRGELGSEGQFVKWDEPTWEKKRQELAAKPAPYPDFPFPGYVATDKLHWLRAEFGEAKTDADKLRIARELLRGAEAAGDKAEEIRWRAEVERRTAEKGPPPRAVKQ